MMAILDRLLHHGEVFYLRGNSYRLRGKESLVPQKGGKGKKKPTPKNKKNNPPNPPKNPPFTLLLRAQGPKSAPPPGPVGGPLCARNA